MSAFFGNKWLLHTAIAFVVSCLLSIAPQSVAGAELTDPSTSVVVQVAPGTSDSVENTVKSLGGKVDLDLSIIDGFIATVPASAIDELRIAPGVRYVTPNGPVSLVGDFDETSLTSEEIHNPSAPDENVYQQEIRSDVALTAGATGRGVTVALVDTGVSDLPDLHDAILPVYNSAGTQKKCVNLSGELGCNDSYGHGTFIAGLIAGNGSASRGKFAGVAPDAKILSVKIAGRDGSANVGKILFAIQWVVNHRDQYNVKVLNLSLGTDSPQSYLHDPLNYAVERAWASGISVVVSAGNRGPNAGTISKPADDPFVITTGAIDDLKTQNIEDDILPDFSSHGPTAADGIAKPDITAPGGHLISLRSPGSAIEEQFPSGGVDSIYRRGSGTSQSAGVVSGSVALLLSAHPQMTPNNVKYALVNGARHVASDDVNAVGAGLIDVAQSIVSPIGEANQGIVPAFGDGSLAQSQGSVNVVVRTDVGSDSWHRTGWSGRNWSGGSWGGGTRYGQPAGGNWYGGNWYGGNWYGGNWYGGNWYGGNWYGAWD